MVWVKYGFAHARASVCTLLLHAPGLVSCVRQHASCQPCTYLFGSCLGFAVLKNNLSLLEGLEFTPPSSARTKGDIVYAVLKNNLSLLEGLEFTPPSSARTKGDIYVPGTYTNIFFLIFRLMRYAYVFFFSLSGVLFTRK